MCVYVGDALGDLGHVHLDGSDLPHHYSTITTPTTHEAPDTKAVPEEVLALHSITASHHDDTGNKKLLDSDKPQAGIVEVDSSSPPSALPSSTEDSPVGSKSNIEGTLTTAVDQLGPSPTPDLEPNVQHSHEFSSTPQTPNSIGLGPEETNLPVNDLQSHDKENSDANYHGGKLKDSDPGNAEVALDFDADMVMVGKLESAINNSNVKGQSNNPEPPPSPGVLVDGDQVPPQGDTGTTGGDTGGAGVNSDLRDANSDGGREGEGNGTLPLPNNAAHGAASPGIPPRTDHPIHSGPVTPGSDSTNAGQPANGTPAVGSETVDSDGDADRAGVSGGGDASSATGHDQRNISANNSSIGANGNTEHDSLAAVPGSPQSLLPTNASLNSGNVSAASLVVNTTGSDSTDKPISNGSVNSSHVGTNNESRTDKNQTVAISDLEFDSKNLTGNITNAVSGSQNGNGSNQNGTGVNQTGNQTEPLSPGGRNGNGGGVHPSPNLIGLPALPTQQREKSVFLRLSNHIDDLQTNMTLFSIFLDQISSKYVLQLASW